MTFKNPLVLSLALILVSGCGLPDWMGSDVRTRMPGQRIAVLELKSSLEPDASLDNIPVLLPAQAHNIGWFYVNQWQNKHLALDSPIILKDTASIGEESEGGNRLLSTPLVVDKTIYILDGSGRISARSTRDPERLFWIADILTDEVPDEIMSISLGKSRKEFLGGNLAYADKILFITTGDGRIFALDTKTGEEVWQRSVNSPIRSAPVAAGGRLFFITVDNQLYVFDSSSGKTLWTHKGLSETTSVLGSPSPAVQGKVVIVPYSSGELFALRIEDGRPVWADSLASARKKYSSVFKLNDIDATPVIDENIVYSASHEGVLTAIDIFSGRRIWEQKISSLNTPWIAGDFIYILSTNDELICLYRPDGRIKWIAPMQSFEDEKNKKDKIIWNGPVLAGEKIYVVGSHGELLAISPVDGTIIYKHKAPEQALLPPVVADKTLFLLNNEADLAYYR